MTDSVILIDIASAFTSGSSQDIVGMLDALFLVETGGQDFWALRAKRLATSVVPALVWLRDNDALMLDEAVIRDHFSNVELLVKLWRHSSLPAEMRAQVHQFLCSIQGWSDQAFDGDSQPTLSADSQLYMQFGYLAMQWLSTLGVLTKLRSIPADFIYGSERARIVVRAMSGDADNGTVARRVSSPGEEVPLAKLPPAGSA